MKNNKLKYLSKSILLEEEGLPKINIAIILTVCVTVALFLVWASIMEVKDTVKADGIYNRELNGGNQATFIVNSNEVTEVALENTVFITIPGVTKKDTIKGRIIDVQLEKRENGAVYIVVANLELTDRQRVLIEGLQLNEIEVSGEIITGSRSVIKYMLGPLWDIGVQAASN